MFLAYFQGNNHDITTHIENGAVVICGGICSRSGGK